MAKTGTQLIASIKDNLGNRPTGTIGVRNIDDVILDKINDIVRHIVRRYCISSIKRIMPLTVTTSAYYYTLPVADVDGNACTVRNLFGMYGVIGTTDRWPIVRTSHVTKLAKFPLTSSSLATGRPTKYVIFGNNIYFDPYPSEDFTVYIWASVWPASILIGQTQPLATEYDDIIEAGATSLIYAALQQPDDYAAWRLIYSDRLKDQLFVEREKPDWNPLEPEITSPDPQNDPFVKTDILIGD